MKLYRLYLAEQIPDIMNPDQEVSNTTNQNQRMPDVDEREESDPQKTKEEIDKMTSELRSSLERLDKTLGTLPALETDTEAKENLVQVMSGLAKLRDSFDDGGKHFNAILSAIAAGGKA